MATPQVQWNLPIWSYLYHVSLPPRAVRRGWELAAPSIDYQHLTSGRNRAGASFVGVEPKNDAFLGGKDELYSKFVKFGFTNINIY